MCPMNQYTRTYIVERKQLRHVAAVSKLAALVFRARVAISQTTTTTTIAAT